MQYVAIKKEIKDGKVVYLVLALTLKNSKGEMKQKIPHPFGDTYLSYETLEDAIKAIELSGFKYVLQDGIKQTITSEKVTSSEKESNYENLILTTLIKQTKDINSPVVSAALVALGELEKFELVDLFIDKMGEDNDQIRTSAINSLLKFGVSAMKPLVKALKDDNWVRRNSAIIAIQKLIELEVVNPESIISVLVKMIEDKNTIVKTSSVVALGKAYKLYKKVNS